jgi:hypothetical protein
MKSPQQICSEMQGIDGSLGALVLRRSRCVASSLPGVFDSDRLNVVAQSLSRLRRLAGKTGYSTPATVLRFEKLSIYAWPANSHTTLAVFCLPEASTTMLDLLVPLALEDLRQLPVPSQI